MNCYNDFDSIQTDSTSVQSKYEVVVYNPYYSARTSVHVCDTEEEAVKFAEEYPDLHRGITYTGGDKMQIFKDGKLVREF